MTLETPLISVILPVYNGERFIAAAIDSVLNQSYQSIELIVVNDGSTDGTEEVLSSFEKQISVINQNNHGPSHARNRGIKAANGVYIAFIDADDVWLSQCLNSHIKQFQMFNNLEISLGLTYKLAFNILDEVDMVNAKSTASLYLSLGASLIKREVFEKVGLFDEDFVLSQDADWFLRARDQKVNIAIQRELILLYRSHSSNRTNNKKLANYYLFKLFKKTKDRREGSDVSLQSIMKKPENEDELIKMWHSAVPKE